MCLKIKSHIPTYEEILNHTVSEVDDREALGHMRKRLLSILPPNTPDPALHHFICNKQMIPFGLKLPRNVFDSISSMSLSSQMSVLALNTVLLSA